MDNELHFLEHKMDVLCHAIGKVSQAKNRDESHHIIGQMGTTTYTKHKILKTKFDILRKNIKINQDEE